jgi:hypothetical protein
MVVIGFKKYFFMKCKIEEVKSKDKNFLIIYTESEYNVNLYNYNH